MLAHKKYIAHLTAINSKINITSCSWNKTEKNKNKTKFLMHFLFCSGKLCFLFLSFLFCSRCPVITIFWRNCYIFRRLLEFIFLQFLHLPDFCRPFLVLRSWLIWLRLRKKIDKQKKLWTNFIIFNRKLSVWRWVGMQLNFRAFVVKPIRIHSVNEVIVDVHVAGANFMKADGCIRTASKSLQIKNKSSMFFYSLSVKNQPFESDRNCNANPKRKWFPCSQYRRDSEDPKEGNVPFRKHL